MNANETTNTTTRVHSGKRRLLWLLVAIPVGVIAGLGVVKAQAMGGGFGWGGGSPEQHKAFMQRRLDRALTLVKATDSQRTAINNIFERAFAEMAPIRQQHQQLHDGMVAAFAANPVDRATVEQLRGQVSGLADRTSQVLTKALLDASDELTPDQRQTLIAHLKEMHGHGHGHGQ